MTTIQIWQGPTGMFYADCPTPGMLQVHRGETLYDLAINVQVSHGTDVVWEVLR